MSSHSRESPSGSEGGPRAAAGVFFSCSILGCFNSCLGEDMVKVRVYE